MTEGSERLHVVRILREMTRLLHADPDELAALRVAALTSVLAAAERAEPYRSLWRDAHPPEGTERLGSLPIADRDAFYALALDDRLVPGATPDLRVKTSGTTGRPLDVAWSSEEDAVNRGIEARQLRASEVPPGPSLILEYGGRRLDPLVVRGVRATIGGAVTPEALVEAVRVVRPTILAGNPLSLLELADLLGGYRLRALFTGGAVVDEISRHELLEAYGTDPLDSYGSWELGTVSWECTAHAGYHVNVDTHIVEVIGDDGRPMPPGEVGEVVVTNLWNRTTPFVRYRIGDLGTLLPDAACPCGIAFPRMGPVVGRSNDWVIAVDGHRVSPHRVLPSMLGTRWTEAMRRFRVIQREPTDFVLEVAWRGPPRLDLVEELRLAQSRAVGAPVTLEVREVPEGWDPRAAKFRLVESLIT